MLKCQSHMIAAVARPRERAARAGRAEKRTYCQTSRADHGVTNTKSLQQADKDKLQEIVDSTI